MIWTTDEYTALVNAYKLGALTVTYGDGTSTTFRSLAQMQTLINQAEKALGINAQPIRQIRFSTSKGI